MAAGYLARLSTEETCLEELLSGCTHLVGLVGSLLGLAVLYRHTRAKEYTLADRVGALTFAMSLNFLYLASSLYHFSCALLAPESSVVRMLRHWDHIAIFFLIAGTYTPFSLVTLRMLAPRIGWSMFGIIWSLAALGITLKFCYVDLFNRVCNLIYLAMGWIGGLMSPRHLRQIPGNGLRYLLSGGITYSVGVLFFRWESLPFSHNIWHLFVLAASALHFACVYVLVVAPKRARDAIQKAL